MSSPVEHNSLFLRPAREQSWAAAAFADISEYLPVKPPPHTPHPQINLPDLDAHIAVGPQNN